MFRNDLGFHRALRDLGVRLKHSEADSEELHKVLMEILAYPLVEEAEKHHRANNMGTLDLMTNQQEMEQKIRDKKIQNLEVCGCCGLMVSNEALPYCTDLHALNMGIGVHLFFRNYLTTALIFLLMLLIYSIYSLTTNLISFNDTFGTQKNILCVIRGSQDDGCGYSALGAGSKVINQNLDSNTRSQVQSWIAVGFTILWGLIFIFKTHMDEKFLSDIEQRRISASDFTLMLTHVPKRILEHPYSETLKYLNDLFSSEEKKANSIFSYEVVKFNIAKPLYLDKNANEKKKQQACEELRKRQDIFRRWMRHRRHYTDFPIPYASREREYAKYEEYFSTNYEYRVNFEAPLEDHNIVFVTFRSSKAREEIESNYPAPALRNLWNLCSRSRFPLRGVNVHRAPEPEEIKWSNIGCPDSRRYARKFVIWVLTVGLIGASLGISIGISFINQNSISRTVSIGISLVVTAVNVGIQLVIALMSTLENEFISSIEQSNIAFKIGVGQLINSIGVPIIVTLIANSNSSVPDKPWLKAGGLVDDVFYIALFSMLVPLGRLVDPWQIFLKFRRWIASRALRRLQMYGQAELNKLYGNYEFDIGYEYSYLIKTSIFTAFFTPMQPIITVFAPVGLLLYYLIDKRNLLRHFQRPTYHSPQIDRTVDFLLLFSPLAFGFGSLLVNNFLEREIGSQDNGTLTINWIIVIVAGAFLFIVPLRIFYCCLSRPKLPLWDYLEKQAVLNSDYDRLNPVTKALAISNFEDYLNSLDKQNLLPMQSQMIRLSIIHHRKNEENKKMLGSSSILVNLQEPQYNYNLDQYRNIALGLNSQVNQHSGDDLVPHRP